MIKRAFDVAASALALLLLCPLFLLVALAIKLDSAGPALFKQTRVGRHFRSFTIYKFRTMSADAAGREITVGADPRITRVGRFLRQAKIDELPQLVNILLGDMTFVGPRPEVPAYVDLFRADYEELLQVRPGLTDLASLKYRDEPAILARAENPEIEYLARLLPDKIRLSKEYLRRACFTYDLALILETFRQVWMPRRVA
jgi:lipopolysaccharide/colanic/teichoic acid biosynthesis glycosyltransferase